ncbi:MAG: UPF0058 family protein [Salinigranum sp.]
MKKNELVHLHALLVRVAEDYVSRGIATPADFVEYERLGVTPMALRAPRHEHERAVRTLAHVLARLSERAPADAVEARARP